MALTDRERLIYSIIAWHSANDPKGYATQKEIVDEVNSAMPGELRWNEGSASHDHCFPIWQAIARINQSDEAEKIVIMDDFRYWLATAGEARHYAECLRSSALKKLRRASDIMRKYRMDGQGDLDGNFREAFA